ncbi:MAG: hypothetical protein ACOX56_02900 [Acholeplasmataceae bacterium]
MLNKFKKIMIIIIIILIGIMTGCKSGVRFKVDYHGRGRVGYGRDISMFSSLDELKDFCVNRNSDTFNEEGEFYMHEINQKLRTFDENFFNDKNLIIYEYDSGHKQKMVIRSMKIVDSTLVITVRENYEVGAYYDIGFYRTMFIVVDKDDVLGIKNIEVKVKEK